MITPDVWWWSTSEVCNDEGEVAKSVAGRGEGDFDNPSVSESGKLYEDCVSGVLKDGKGEDMASTSEG